MNQHVPPQTMSAREFNQHTGRAKLAADNAPLIVTDRGEPAYVLLRYSDYEALTSSRDVSAKKMSVAEALNDPRPEADIDFEFPRLKWTKRMIEFDR
jgi:PHD/YefM family antitoxin component YafN of YafNO toxin-antitoxin module